MTDAYYYVKANGGINSAASYPYTGVNGTCKYNASKIAAKCTGIANLSPNDETVLQEAVATKGPVSVLIAASGFDRYNSTSGIYDSPVCGTTISHAGELSLINFFSFLIRSFLNSFGHWIWN
jgi:cathepsin L